MVDEHSIMGKITSAGSPPSEWSQGAKVRCGIGAGYRQTFVVDEGSDEGKYVCAVLNSMLGRWFALYAPQHPGVKTAGAPAAAMPIPQIGAEARQRYVALADRIIAAKAADPEADTAELEESVDWLVFDLYDLTNEETAIVADAFWEGTMTEEEEDAAFVRMMEEALAEEGYCDISETKEILRGISEGSS